MIVPRQFRIGAWRVARFTPTPALEAPPARAGGLRQ